MEQKRKGFPDGIKTVVQMLAYFGIVRACRHVPALVMRKPVVIGLVVPKGQTDLYQNVSLLIVGRGRYGTSEAVVTVVAGDPKKRQRNESDIAENLLDFERIVVIAESSEHLPPRFAITADAVVETPAISARDIVAAVRLLTGMQMAAADAEVAATASLDILSGAFRKGRPLAAAMRVLRAAITIEARPAREMSGPALEDLHGLGEAGDWGRELALDLADWRDGKIPWADVERGILLSGAPGTGKTTFAAALARTCGVDIVTGSIASWQSRGHMGDMLKAMYAAFAEAKSKAPAILFVDEVDAIGDRQQFTGENVQYCTEIVNAFLECLDGIDGREGVVVVAACNNPDRLDAAITRPGRLDRHVVIPLPDAAARGGILRWHLQDALTGDDLSHIADRTEGASGAALEQLVRQARRTARRARRDMQLRDLVEELPALVPLPAKSVWRTAVHEAGHAVVGLAGGRWHVVAAHVVTCAARMSPGMPTGGVEFSDAEELMHASAEDYRARIMRSLGGLAAEEIFFGERTDGGGGVVGSDLYNATIAATAMEASLGLGSGLAFLSTFDSEDLLRTVRLDHALRMRVEKTLSECHERALQIIRDRRGDVERLAQALCDKGRLTGEEVADVLDAQPQLMLLPKAS